MKVEQERLQQLVCPWCAGDFREVSGGLECVSCKKSFGDENGIPLLFCPNDWDGKEDVTQKIKAFYEQTPFPNYEDIDSASSLRNKAEKGIFAKLLDEQIQPGAEVLEFGCGTGQLSNFLGLTWGRKVSGADMCLNSLKLAQNFKEQNEIDAVRFYQMNLFRPAFKPETFDVVICNGVLHHTSDPYLGYQSLLKLVKKGGFIVIGLYHAHGRLMTDIRRVLFQMTGNRLKFLDPRLKSEPISDLRKHTWFMDQYRNPHESKHTIHETLGWFDKTGVEFINSLPKPTPWEKFTEEDKLFEKAIRGSAWDHFLTEFPMIFSGDREGGFFVMIGRKT